MDYDHPLIWFFMVPIAGIIAYTMYAALKEGTKVGLARLENEDKH